MLILRQHWDYVLHFIYLFEKHRQSVREISFISWFTSQMPTAARDETGLRQGWGAPFGCPIRPQLPCPDAHKQVTGSETQPGLETGDSDKGGSSGSSHLTAVACRHPPTFKHHMLVKQSQFTLAIARGCTAQNKVSSIRQKGMQHSMEALPRKCSVSISVSGFLQQRPS